MIHPADPAAWVHQPVDAFGGRNFLDAINGDNGAYVAVHYLDTVEGLIPGPDPQAPQGENLGRLLHFDSADLDSNRAGFLSANQRRRLGGKTG